MTQELSKPLQIYFKLGRKNQSTQSDCPPGTAVETSGKIK